MLERPLSKEQFKLLALHYKTEKKKSKRKADEDVAVYMSRRLCTINKRHGYNY